MPLKVCLVVNYDMAREGGVKKHALHLAEALRALGDTVKVIAPTSDPAADPRPDTQTFAGVVTIKSNGSEAPVGMLVRPWQVRRFLHAEAFDVVHVHEPSIPGLAWYGTWFAGRAARVATFHAFNESEGCVARLGRRLSGVQLRLFDRGIAVSPAAARYASVCWSGPLAIIPNGIDTRRFRPGPARPPQAGRPLRLLFVGNWSSERKGLPTLVAAYDRLRARGVDLTLDVVGDGGGATRPVSHAPGITFHGPVNREDVMLQHYLDCDLFVAPSTGMESFGIVLLEAMATGRPIVCSDIEGYRAVVSPDGARLAPPGDAEALADAIAELAGAPPLRQRMGEANRQASGAFDWPLLAARVRDEYCAALAR